MHWLIITENQEKASSIREVLRGYTTQTQQIEATIVSSRGLPWTIEVEVTGSELNYKIVEKDSYKEILVKIDQVALEADRILLAFEPTTTGEAIAWEFEKRLGSRKCARFKTLQLDPKTIISSLINLESLDNIGLPKSNQNMAKSHWSQAIIDLTWTSKVNSWLSNFKEGLPKITRLMGIVIKTIGNRQRRTKRVRATSHWELELELKPASKVEQDNTKVNETIKAKVIVPTLAQVGKGSGPKAQEFWKLKLEQSKQESLKGWETPQPEPGKPWRFHQQEDAKIQKQYIKKFPYFLIEAKSEVSSTKPLQCPPTNSSIHMYCMEEAIGTPAEVEKSLNTLYTKGWITNPKSNFPSLHAKTIQSLYSYAKTQRINLSQENRVFHSDNNLDQQLQAICPTSWELTPRKIATEIKKSKSIQALSNEQLRLEKIYKKIYTLCLESQLPEVKTKIERHFLSGPLFLNRQQVQERDGKKFHIKKEEPLHAHMSVLLLSHGELPSKEGEVMECAHVHTQEIKKELPKDYSGQSLAHDLCTQGVGKRETIANILTYLSEKNIVNNDLTLKLTPQGEELLATLENHFGQYLDQNYVMTLNSNLNDISRGLKNDKEFLNSWWYSLRNFLDSQSDETKLLY